MFALLFAGLLLPMFSRMIKQSEPVGQLVKLSYSLIIVPGIILVAGCVFYRHQLMELLYHHHVSYSANLFAILMGGFLSISTTYIFGTLLTANGSLKALNIMALLGMIVNVILNLVLIPKYQALGAAVSSLITQTFTALVQVILAIYVFKFNLNYKLLFLLLIFASGVTLFGFIASNLTVNWLISALVFAAASAVLAFALGVIRIKNLYHIIKNRE
jgi:O-antigen/teichoic acid export membrane protein